MSRFLAVLLALVPTVAVATDIVPAAPRDRPLLLRGAEVHTISAGVLANHDVLIGVDGRIEAIGAGLDAPADAEVIDLAGQMVMPGFIALQTTLGITEISAVRASVDTTEIGDVTPEAAAHLAWNPDSEIIPTVRRVGIAVAQVAPTAGFGGGLFKGSTAVLRLDGWTKEDAALRLSWGQQLRWPASAVRQRWNAPPEEEQKKRMKQEREKLELTLDAAFAYHHSRTQEESFPVDVSLEALRPIVAGEQPLFILADDSRQIAEALELTARRGLKMVLVGGAEAEVHASTLAARGIPVVLGAVHGLPYRDDHAYDAPYTLPARLAAAGVSFGFSKVGASWDARNVPFQAGHAIGFGLDRDTALRALTLDAAKILGVDDKLGSIEVGKEATLVVGHGDFLDPLRHHVTMLLISGRSVDLDSRHERLYRKYDERLKRLGK